MFGIFVLTCCIRHETGIFGDFLTGFWLFVCLFFLLATFYRTDGSVCMPWLLLLAEKHGRQAFCRHLGVYTPMTGVVVACFSVSCVCFHSFSVSVISFVIFSSSYSHLMSQSLGSSILL